MISVTKPMIEPEEDDRRVGTRRKLIEVPLIDNLSTRIYNIIATETGIP